MRDGDKREAFVHTRNKHGNEQRAVTKGCDNHGLAIDARGREGAPHGSDHFS
jgi:hypothetical protein